MDVKNNVPHIAKTSIMILMNDVIVNAIPKHVGIRTARVLSKRLSGEHPKRGK